MKAKVIGNTIFAAGDGPEFVMDETPFFPGIDVRYEMLLHGFTGQAKLQGRSGQADPWIDLIDSGGVTGSDTTLKLDGTKLFKYLRYTLPSYTAGSVDLTVLAGV